MFGSWKACLICQAYGVEAWQLCRSCSSRVVEEAKQSEKFSSDYEVPVRLLLSWTRENSLWVQPLVYALKGGGVPWLFSWLAEQFCTKHRDLNWGTSFAYVVPGKNDRTNHAQSFAIGLAELALAPVSQVHELNTDKKQRQKSQQDRQARSFLEREDLGRAVLVDDIATTGATLRAMEKALRGATVLDRCVIAARARDML